LYRTIIFSLLVLNQILADLVLYKVTPYLFLIASGLLLKPLALVFIYKKKRAYLDYSLFAYTPATPLNDWHVRGSD
jgi:hypothetical protein